MLQFQYLWLKSQYCSDSVKFSFKLLQWYFYPYFNCEKTSVGNVLENLWSVTFFNHSTKFQKNLLHTPQFLFVIDVDNIYPFKLVSRTQTASCLRQKRNSDRDTFHVRRMFFYNTYFEGIEFGLKIKFCNLLEYLSVELSTCKKKMWKK